MADDVIVKFKADISDIQNDLNKIKGQVSGLGTTAEQTAKKTESAIGGAMKSIGPQILAAFSVTALVNFGKQILEVTGQFQKLEAVLSNTLGSKGQAKSILNDIKKFAAETNFGVKELTESYVKLANQGFKPTIDQLRKLADLANSTGKSFDQLTEAIIDAQTGEFERLKEFGIRAQKEGDKVTFTFKGVQQQVDFTNDSIREYILSLGDLEGVMGSTEAISKTLTGQISNMQDAWEAWLNSLGSNTEGIFSSAIGFLTDLLGTATRVNEEINKLTIERIKVHGKEIEIFKFQQENIQKNLEATFEVEKANIDKIKTLNADKAVAYDKSTAEIQKNIQKRAELNAISLELIYAEYDRKVSNKLLAGKEVDKAEEEMLLRQIYRYEQEKEYLQTELPNALGKYRDEVIKNIKPVEEKAKKTEKLVGAYEQLTKAVSEAQAKIKNNAALGIFSEGDIDKLSELEAKLKAVNAEIAMQTNFFEKQATIRETTTISPLTPSTDIGQRDGSKDSERLAAYGKRNEEELESMKKKLEYERELEKQARAEKISAAQDLIGSIGQVDQQLRDQRIQGLQEAANIEQQILEDQLKRGQITREQYEKKTQDLSRKTRSALREEQLKQFNIDKTLALTNIAINGAQAISKALTTGPAAAVLVPLVSATIAAQAALVLSQQPPKFEKGGIIKGRRHSQGGTLIEAEGGEYISSIPVTNKYFPELEAMKNNTFDKLIERQYIAPALKKQKQEFEQSMAANMWKSMQIHASLKDENLIMSDRETRKVLREIKQAINTNNNYHNVRFNNV